MKILNVHVQHFVVKVFNLQVYFFSSCFFGLDSTAFIKNQSCEVLLRNG